MVALKNPGTISTHYWLEKSYIFYSYVFPFHSYQILIKRFRMLKLSFRNLVLEYQYNVIELYTAKYKIRLLESP